MKFQGPMHPLMILYYFSGIYVLRAFTSANSIIFYFTISKTYFINYTIPFSNTPNIPTFIFLFYSLK